MSSSTLIGMRRFLCAMIVAIIMCLQLAAIPVAHARSLQVVMVGTPMNQALPDDLQRTWHDAARRSLPSREGCFTVSYPAHAWMQVPCSQPVFFMPPHIPSYLPRTGPMNSKGIVSRSQSALQTIGNGVGDFVANATGGPISLAEGSFPAITNLIEINDPVNGSNTYSLQLNSNFFTVTDSSVCNDCTGWVQFVYQNMPNSGVAYGSLWYILLNQTSCPSSAWELYYGNCFLSYYVSVPMQPIAGLSNIRVYGQTANGTDSMTVAVGSTLYTVNQPSVLGDFSSAWQSAEYNIFGVGSYAAVGFNDGVSFSVLTSIANGTTNAPSCSSTSYTGETSALNLTSPCSTNGGTLPSISFTEGNGGGTAAPIAPTP